MIPLAIEAGCEQRSQPAILFVVEGRAKSTTVHTDTKKSNKTSTC